MQLDPLVMLPHKDASHGDALSSKHPGHKVTHILLKKSKWQLCDNMENYFLGFEPAFYSSEANVLETEDIC